MRHKFEVNLENRWIKVHNISNELIKVEFVDSSSNFCIYQSTNGRSCFSLCNFGGLKKLRVYLREEFSQGIDLHVYDFEFSDNKYEVSKIEKEESFDFNREIILINGFAGGGTSIVTKFLKSLGVNAGDDSGPLYSRKPHEAYGFKLWIDGLSEKLPIIHHKENFLKITKTYGYQADGVNVIKVPESHLIINHLLEILPNLKVLSVVKKPTNFFVTTEGERFQKQSDFEIYKVQYSNVEGCPIFHLDFNKFFTDYTYTNKVLRYINYENLLRNQDHLDYFKRSIDFNERVLDMENK